MANEKLISFDLKSDFAFFKKPDTNTGLQLSYNMIHKPVLLGVLGAIVGLKGYEEGKELPEYYQKLQHLKIGIEPLQHEGGNFQKTVLKYTNGVGYANKDGNLIVEEVMLIAPNYRCFLLLDIDNELEAEIYENILSQTAEFIPYLGKNEFQAWFENPGEWDFKIFDEKESFTIDSIFIKPEIVNKQISKEVDSLFNPLEGSFIYFERLPLRFDEFKQYQLENFSFTDWKMKGSLNLSNFYSIKNDKITKNIQLF